MCKICFTKPTLISMPFFELLRQFASGCLILFSKQCCNFEICTKHVQFWMEVQLPLKDLKVIKKTASCIFWTDSQSATSTCNTIWMTLKDWRLLNFWTIQIVNDGVMMHRLIAHYFVIIWIWLNHINGRWSLNSFLNFLKNVSNSFTCFSGIML